MTEIYFNRNGRDEYCDNAVGFVQVKVSDRRKWTLFCRITPETSNKAPSYIVEMRIDFEKIIFVRCYHCLAQRRANFYLAK